MSALLQDLRFALRTLRKSPGFTTTAILTLALGIGSVAVVFTVAERSILNPLPFHHSEQLVSINEIVPIISKTKTLRVTAPDFLDYQSQSHSFSAVAAYNFRNFELSGGLQPEQVQAMRATASLFPILQVAPELGRPFTQEEDDKGLKVCVISDRLWRRWFGADRGALGKTIALDRAPFTVLGVMPPTFDSVPDKNSEPTKTDIWLPMSFSPAERMARADNWDYNAIARLKPGITVAQATADVNAIARRILQDFLDKTPEVRAMNFTFSALAVPLGPQISSSVRPLVLALGGAVMFVLLIACINVANLLLARGAGRQQEIAVRLALGATRLRVAQQIVVESLLLALAGSLAGALLAWWAASALPAVAPPRFALLAEATFDWKIVGASVAVALLCAVITGLAPAFAATRSLNIMSLRERSAAAPHGSSRLRSLLVAAELASATILLIGAGLLMRTFTGLVHTRAGFEPGGAVAGAIRLPSAEYKTLAEQREFYDRLLAQLRSLPGTDFAGVGATLPLKGTRSERSITPEGYVSTEKRIQTAAMTPTIGDYLQAIGADLLRGRYLTHDDTATALPVAVVNESLAKRYWPNQDAVGKRLRWGNGSANKKPWLTIVGVVADLKQFSLDAQGVDQVFVPGEQLATTAFDNDEGFTAVGATMGQYSSMFVVVRGRGAEATLEAGLRNAVRSIDKSLALAHVEPLRETYAESAAPERFNMLLMGGFAALALLLAAIGVYGVIAYSVAQRTREIGVRIALGAGRGDVLRMVLGAGARLAAMACAIGLVIAAALTPLLKSLLYGVKPLDVLTFVAVPAVLFAAAALASYVPAARATKLDPLEALRHE